MRVNHHRLHAVKAQLEPLGSSPRLAADCKQHIVIRLQINTEPPRRRPLPCAVDGEQIDVRAVGPVSVGRAGLHGGSAHSKIGATVQSPGQLAFGRLGDPWEADPLLLKLHEVQNLIQYGVVHHHHLWLTDAGCIAAVQPCY